jgi:Ala-tRNA(Pro) deacylase
LPPIVARLGQFLDANGVTYETLQHRVDYRAETTALDTHTSPDRFAKSVVLLADGRPLLAVVPSTRTISLRRVQEATGADDVVLAGEDHVAHLFPDCEVGAAPPFGNLYGLPVYASPLLADHDELTFNAGSHRVAVRMRFADFERLVRPSVIALCKQE